MKYQMTARRRGGFDNFTGTEPDGWSVEVSVDEIVRLRRAKDELFRARIASVKPCGCYQGRYGYNPTFYLDYGVQINLCTFHATRPGDSWIARWSGTLSEVYAMNAALGKPLDAGLPKLTPEDAP
jgi:hypothetical protein